MTHARPTRIVVLGGGFAGVYAVMQLERLLGRNQQVEITLVNKDNFFVFTPMLHEVAASDLDLTHIVNPIRKLLRRAHFFHGDILAAIRGGRRKAFAFKTLGQLAAIGRRTGVANILGMNFSGFVAWWLWRTIYLMKLPRFERKVRVALDWTLDLLFTKDLVQCPTTRGLAAAVEDDAVAPAPGLRAVS